MSKTQTLTLDDLAAIRRLLPSLDGAAGFALTAWAFASLRGAEIEADATAWRLHLYNENFASDRLTWLDLAYLPDTYDLPDGADAMLYGAPCRIVAGQPALAWGGADCSADEFLALERLQTAAEIVDQHSDALAALAAVAPALAGRVLGDATRWVALSSGGTPEAHTLAVETVSRVAADAGLLLAA